MDSRRKGWMSRVGIVVIAAIIVEIISVLQYQRLQALMSHDVEIRSRIVMSSMLKDIMGEMEISETVMRENLWNVKLSTTNPDSVFSSMVRMIDDNPHMLGGCLAFVPDYYPSKGRLFEPYAGKLPDGTIVVEQIASPDHDYTTNEAYIKVTQTLKPAWSEPYRYGTDSLSMVTLSYPVMDDSGRLMGVCGLDLDISWLSETLNDEQRYKSSFALLLTEEGKLVAGPSEDRASKEKVEQVVNIVNGILPASTNPTIAIRTRDMEVEPYWQLVQVYKMSEVYAKIRRMRLQHTALVLLGLAILAFMINRYARNEKKLRNASEEQARIGGELAAARSIQQQMLPKAFPSYMYGLLEPAREVGGDLFDYFTRDGKLFFCIGDVSGKGVPSAMLMSMAQSLFRLVSQKEDRPSRILAALNQEICRGNDNNMFLTFFVGCLDLYSGELSFGNAGHDKPFVLSGDIAILPTKANLPLGVFPDTHFEDQTCSLAPGTTLLLYTDGLTEYKNVNRQQFGKDGVKAHLKQYLESGDNSLETLVNSMSEAVRRFAGEAPQGDDLTMLAVRYDSANLLHGEITIPNKREELLRFTAFIKDFLGNLEIDKKISSSIRLALEEAVVNVIDYAYPEGKEGDILIQADSNNKEIRIKLIDSGIPFDPTTVLEADTTLDAENRPIGGLGILLARKLTDTISYSRRSGQNVLTLTKSIQ